MELRKKPIPSPLARPTERRPLVPAQVRRSLPTIAALLAATAALSSAACRNDAHIEPDREPGHEIVAVVKYMPSAVASHADAPAVTSPPPPPPGMGALEVAAEPPAPPPPKVRPVHPPPLAHPPMVKGGAKAVIPTPHPKKLSGDVAIVYPIDHG
jgi:hypothetical protein